MRERTAIVLLLLIGFFFTGCNHKEGDIQTKVITVGENKVTVQLMPPGFHEERDDGKNEFDYFKVIIETKVKLVDKSQLNYANFGMENSIMKVIKADTILPAFVQRIANGKKDNYEYIVSFDKKSNEKEFDIYIDDHVFAIGQVSIKF